MINDFLDKCIYEVYENLSIRTENVLKEANILTFRDLTNMTSGSLLEKKCFGKKCLRDVRVFLRKFDLHLKDDILLSNEEHKKIFLSIPEAVVDLQHKISDAVRKLRNLSFDLDHILTSIQK